MRILLTGAEGQVGWELRRTLAPLGTVLATDRAALDLTDAAAVRRTVGEFAPDWVVNAAAYTAVDAAESDEATAHLVNADVPGTIGAAMAARGGRVLHFSTDYVFSGRGTRALTERDPCAPLGAYGRSKLAGEQALAASGACHVTLRVQWVYGARGRNFMRTIRRLARERDALRVVADQVGVPTWSRAIAEAAALLLARAPRPERSATYHLAGEGSCSWHEFAQAILALDPDPATLRARTVEAITTAEYPTAAPRPAHAVLDASLLQAEHGLRLPHWRQQLELCLAELSARAG